MSDPFKRMKTHCGRLDHGGCGITVGVRDNRIEDVQPDPEGFLNQGYICVKGRWSHQRLYHPDRLTRPLRRRGERGAGQWDPIPWSLALQMIRERFRQIRSESGARSVAFCQGMPKGLEHFALIRLANLFGSPNVVAVQDVCHAPREIAGYHTCGFYPVADYHHPGGLVMVWGGNPTCTNEEGLISSRLLQRIENGADLIVVDPRETELASRADLWLQIRPGADLLLTLAMLQVIVDENLYRHDFVRRWTRGFEQLVAHVRRYAPESVAERIGVPADLIRRAARRYAQASPAAIGWGNAIEQQQTAYQTARTLVCLMAVCGNLDVAGGNIQAVEPPVASLADFVCADRIPNKKKEMIHVAHHTVKGLMTVPPAYFRRAVLQQMPYPVRGAYMQCTNPLVTWADSRLTYRALQQLEFFVVSDVFMTPTAAMADVVLPAATQFEFNDIGHYGLGHGVLLARPQVVDPPRECWPDIKIINELGKALTPEDLWFDDYCGLLQTVLAPAGVSFAEFCRRGHLNGAPRFEKYLQHGFKTPSGKVELALSQADRLNSDSLPAPPVPKPPSGDFPLWLTSAKSRYYLHSSYRWVAPLRDRAPQPLVWLHPATAANYRIRPGQAVVIETATGRMVQQARLSEAIRTAVGHAASGWWFPESSPSSQFDWRRANYNMLTNADDLGRECGTPDLKGIPCRIRRK